MRKVDINFAPAAKHKQCWEVPVLLLGIVGTILAGLDYRQIDELNEDWQDRSAKLRRVVERNDYELAGSDSLVSAGATPQDARAPSGRAWNALLDHLEDSIDDSVTLLSFQGGAASDRLELQAEAKDAQSIFAFMERIDTGSFVTSIALANQEVVRDHPQKPVRFNISGKWNRIDGGNQ